MKLFQSFLFLIALFFDGTELSNLVQDLGIRKFPFKLTTEIPPSAINLSSPSFEYLSRRLQDQSASSPQPKDHRFYLYQRVKLPLDKDRRIGLHFGLNNETFTSEPILFLPDIASTHTMINLNNNQCLEENSCFALEASETNADRYLGKDYKFFVGQSFVGVNRVRPGELDVASVKEVPDLHQLPIRFFDNVVGLGANVLGLAPNSPIWAHWARVYHFPEKLINLSFSFNREEELLMFDSAINHEHEVLFRAEKKRSFFMFLGDLEIKQSAKPHSEKADKAAGQANVQPSGADEGAKGQQDSDKKYSRINICVANRADMTMRLNPIIFDAVKNSLCKNAQDCGKAADLAAEQGQQVELKMEDHKDPKKFFLEIFYHSALYKLEDNKIVWRIDRLTPEEEEAGCQLVLDQAFLRQKYLLISNDIEDKDFIYVGFKLMAVTDFYKFDFYNVTLILLILASISLVVIYFILNHSLKKLLRKEKLEA